MSSSNNRKSAIVRRAVGVICAFGAGLVISAKASAEPASIVSATQYDAVWGNSVTRIVYAPTSGGANVTCDLYGGDTIRGGSYQTAAATMAQVAKIYKAQFSSIDISCPTPALDKNATFEMTLHKGGDFIYIFADGSFFTEYTWLNNTGCYAASIHLAGKVALAMATNMPMTRNCTYVSWAQEGIMDITF